MIRRRTGYAANVQRGLLAMPAGLTKRICKKRYKAALTRIADKIPAAFASKADRKRWISEVTNLFMQDMRGKRNAGT